MTEKLVIFYAIFFTISLPIHGDGYDEDLKYERLSEKMMLREDDSLSCMLPIFSMGQGRCTVGHTYLRTSLMAYA